MKKIITAVVLVSLGMMSSTFAAQEINNSHGKQKVGVISASNAQTLDQLSEKLSHSADKKGASLYKITSTSGNNLIHGTANIYN